MTILLQDLGDTNSEDRLEGARHGSVLMSPNRGGRDREIHYCMGYQGECRERDRTQNREEEEEKVCKMVRVAVKSNLHTQMCMGRGG